MPGAALASCVQVELDCARGHDDEPVGLQLLPEGDKEGQGSSRKISSGNYRGGFCMLEAPRLPAGRYVLTASTFEPAHECGFELVVNSAAQVGAAWSLLRSWRPVPGHCRLVRLCV